MTSFQSETRLCVDLQSLSADSAWSAIVYELLAENKYIRFVVLFTRSLIFLPSPQICFEWQRLRASVLPDRWRPWPATATATGDCDSNGKVNEKATLSQEVQGANAKEEGCEEEDEEEEDEETAGRRRGGAEKGR